jgi:S-adenosylmethionine hydrolase
MAGHDTISFLSDYGHEDEFVGVVHSVIRGIAPDVRVIDLTHGIPAHDTRAGGLALARAVQYVAPGVILAVVDPGVGSERRAVAVEVGGGAGILVGPDNGLLAPAVAMAGGATAAVELTEEAYHLPSPGPTFAGRDIFAPVAAHLCTGVGLDELGPAIDLGTLLPGLLPVSRHEGDVLVAEVLWVDRFGNAQLNLDPDDLSADRHTLTAGTVVRTATRAVSYADVPPGGVGLVVDAYGLVSVALDRHSAAGELGLEAGTEVRLQPLEDDGRGHTSPVAFPTTRREA